MGHAYSASWSDRALTEETWQELLFPIQPYPSYDIKTVPNTSICILTANLPGLNDDWQICSVALLLVQ